MKFKRAIIVECDPRPDIQAHIDALENKPFQSFLELRDLLNLGRNPKINRIPSMKEQNAFRFLLIIDEFKKSSG